MRASTPTVKIFTLFSLLLLVTFPRLSLGEEPLESIDSAAISWVTDYYQTRCDSWSQSNKKDVFYYNKQFQTQCLHIFQIGKQEYDSVNVLIYTIGMNMSDIGFDKLLIQKKYKDGHSQFELIWDDPKDIDQIIKIMDFFEKYKGFPTEVQLDCIVRIVHIYTYSKYR